MQWPSGRFLSEDLHLSALALPFLLALVETLPPALAYIDPGTGSFLLQLLVGSLLGVLLSLKMFWRRVKAYVAGLFGRGGESA